jgi:hypothetical protein
MAFNLPFNFGQIIQNIGSLLRGKPQDIVSPVPDTNPTPMPSMFPSRESLQEGVEEVYRSHMPRSMRETTPVADYYPAASHFDDFMGKEDLRPGAGALGALQAFYESTGGRNSSNLFGVKPGGKVSKFNSPEEAIDYQYGPNVLGGGANPNMNILNTKEPLTGEDIKKLYESYNPAGDYLESLLDDFVAVIEHAKKRDTEKQKSKGGEK